MSHLHAILLEVTQAMQAAVTWKSQKLSFAKRARALQGRGGASVLLAHFKSMGARAAFSVSLHSSFVLQVEGSKFQEPAALLMGLEKGGLYALEQMSNKT